MLIAKTKRRDVPEGIYVLSKGCSPFFVSKFILLEFDYPYYEEDSEIDEELYFELKKLNEIYLCRKKALDLLSRREHTKLEMKAKLVQREFSNNAIFYTINYLVEKNYLSEERYCEAFIMSRNKKGEGKFLIIKRLQNKGISSSIATSIYDELINYEKEFSACSKALDKIINKNNDKDIVKYKLSKKGFFNSVINDVINQNSDNFN